MVGSSYAYCRYCYYYCHYFDMATMMYCIVLVVAMEDVWFCHLLPLMTVVVVVAVAAVVVNC